MKQRYLFVVALVFFQFSIKAQDNQVEAIPEIVEVDYQVFWTEDGQLTEFDDAVYMETYTKANGKRNGKYKKILLKDSLALIEGLYKKGIRVGEWKYFHKNGNLNSIVDFVALNQIITIEYFSDGNINEVKEIGLSNRFLQGYSPSGEQAVIDGNGYMKFYNDSGKILLREGQYKDGLKEGKFIFYNDEGDVVAEKVYKAGKTEFSEDFVNTKKAVKKGETVEFADQTAEYPGGFMTFRKEVARKFQVTEEFKNSDQRTARALIQFLVDEHGEIREAFSIKSVGYGLENEALRCLYETNKKFTPGQSGGKAVKVWITLPVTIVNQ